MVYGIPLEEGEDYFLTFTGKKKSLSVATVNQDPKAGLVLISVSPSKLFTLSVKLVNPLACGKTLPVCFFVSGCRRRRRRRRRRRCNNVVV